MADQTLKQLRTAGKFISEANLKAIALAYIESDPDGTPDSIAANLGVLMRQMYKIAPSVASNNLTLAVQHLDGTNPSATNPLAFKVGNSWKLVTSTLSVTKIAGTNWCNAGSAELAANAIDFCVYVINETGASAGTKVGFSRIFHARTMADFVNTTTSAKYIAGSWTNFNATDEVEVIGRFRAQLSAAAAYNWSIASALVIHRPIYETDWSPWLPTYTAQAGTFNTVTTVESIYKIISDYISIALYATGTTSATPTYLEATTPVLSANAATATPIFAARTIDGGSGLTAQGFLNVATQTIRLHKTDSSIFGAGAFRLLAVAGNYRI